MYNLNCLITLLLKYTLKEKEKEITISGLQKNRRLKKWDIWLLCLEVREALTSAIKLN